MAAGVRAAARQHPPRGRRWLSSKIASLGDTVAVHYRGMLVDGRVFHNTIKSPDGPVKFTLGERKVIEGLEEAVLNMHVGEKKTTQLQPHAAFGDIRPELILFIPSSKVPAEIFADIKSGQMISLTDDAQGEVIARTPKGLTVDLNHPLAGETVIFELDLVSIQGNAS
eukprot:Tamp_30549.p1 GENE.Tamp_30549~~Tamp_30549.p1  ORF type:complete len:176 (+),score=33.07 Tamp_30549:27-530(+)